jgi:hypothetical protein
MHLRLEDLKEWREDFQNLSRISLLSIPITNHESGSHVDIRVPRVNVPEFREIPSCPRRSLLA